MANNIEQLTAHGVIAVTLQHQNIPAVGWMASQRIADDIVAQLKEAGYTIARDLS